MSYLLTQYGIELEIDTTPDASTRNYVTVCDGFNNMTEALNEQVQEYFFLCGKGFGSDEVTGLHPVLSLSGVRKVGDPAQDFIFGRRLAVLDGRKTNLRLSVANADGTITRYTNRVTMKNISSFGGATVDGAAVTVDFSFNGRPFTEVMAATSSMTLTSVAGTDVGTTVLTATPTFPDAGAKFVYQYSQTSTPPAVTNGSVVTDWNDFTNGATYDNAPGGGSVTVAMVSISSYVVIAHASAQIVRRGS